MTCILTSSPDHLAGVPISDARHRRRCRLDSVLGPGYGCLHGAKPDGHKMALRCCNDALRECQVCILTASCKHLVVIVTHSVSCRRGSCLRRHLVTVFTSSWVALVWHTSRCSPDCVKTHKRPIETIARVLSSHLDRVCSTIECFVHAGGWSTIAMAESRTQRR